MEDNTDLYELMGDLRELGIGEDRIYFNIMSYITSVDPKTLFPIVKIILPEYNKSRKKINVCNIFNDLSNIKYKIEFDQHFKRQLGSLRTFFISNIQEEIHMVVSKAEHKIITPKSLLENLHINLIIYSRIDLFIDGVLVGTKDK